MPIGHMKHSKAQVEAALLATSWDKTAAAKLLGTTRQTVYTLMGRYALNELDSASSTMRVKYSTLDSRKALTHGGAAAHLGNVNTEATEQASSVDGAATFRMSFFLPARHRAWLKRKATEQQIEQGGHDSMSDVLVTLLDKAMTEAEK